MHTFLLVNGFDLDVSSKAAYEFMIKALEDGKFRFAFIREWIARAPCSACWIDPLAKCLRHAAHAHFGTISTYIFQIRLFFALFCMYNPARLVFTLYSACLVKEPHFHGGRTRQSN